MKTGLTEIICIFDKSASMGGKESDVVGGFNTFLEGQKILKGEAKLTLTLFDTKFQIIMSGVPLEEVPPLTEATYHTGGLTALVDAIGKTLDEVGARLAATDESERPEHVVVCIMTDGQENSSTEYTREQVKEKLRVQQEDYNWQIVYLGADQDAFTAADGYGIGRHSTMAYVGSGKNHRRAMSGVMGMCVSMVRGGGEAVVDPSDMDEGNG